MKTIFTIAKKEFLGFFNSPLAYSIIVPFLLITVFLYTRDVLVSQEATMRPYFDLLPWFILLLAPALSMKLLTDEMKSNTIELLFAHPVTELQIVAGKFAGVFAFYAVILATTLTLPITLLVYSHADVGQIVGQYLGALFIGGVMLAIGLAASAFVGNAISSFLLAAAVGFVLLVIGLDFITLALPYPVNQIASEVSILTHSGNIARGLIDFRDVSYFVTIIVLALMACVAKLSSRRLIEDAAAKRRLVWSYGLVVGIGIVINVLLASYPVKLDLTRNRLFTLSEGTRQTLKNLPDVVNIKVYTSKTLPAQMQLVLRDVGDTLRDYQGLSGKIRVSYAYPDADPATASEAQSAGIQQMTFNKIGSGSYEVQAGYLGLAIRYGDKTESIPFIGNTSDLEYQLTRRIRKVTQLKESVIGLLNLGNTQTTILTQVLQSQYQVNPISGTATVVSPDVTALVVIDDGTTSASESATLVKSYLNRGGKVILLINGVAVNQQYLMANKSDSLLLGVTGDMGINVAQNLVYDTKLSELLTFGSGNARYLAQYPYWLKSLPADSKFGPLAGIQSISLLWPSLITVDKQPGVTYHNLLTTSRTGGVSDDITTLTPDKLTALVPSGVQLLAVEAQKGDTTAVVIGSASIAEDQMLNNNQDNISLLANLVDNLATDPSLAAIPAKSSTGSVFNFANATDPAVFQYGNLIIGPLVVVIFAVIYLRRRSKLAHRIYSKKLSLS